MKYLIIVLFLMGCFNKVKNKREGLKDKIFITQIDSLKSIIKEGDIIFRGGTDIESAIIRDFSYNDKLFSHCGIILKQNDKSVVTHILGGTTNPDGNILSQTVDDFFAYPDNESAGVYKIALDSIEMKRVYQFVDSVKKRNITFDLKFNLLDKSKLYCNEFIIDALNFAKNNKPIFPHTSFYLKNTKYFAVSNKGDSFLFYPIDAFQHNKILTEKAIFYFPNYTK